MNIREEIKARMDTLKLFTGKGERSPYAVIQLMDHQITTECLRSYLDGETAMTADRLELVINALGGESIAWAIHDQENKRKRLTIINPITARQTSTILGELERFRNICPFFTFFSLII